MRACHWRESLHIEISSLRVRTIDGWKCPFSCNSIQFILWILIFVQIYTRGCTSILVRFRLGNHNLLVEKRRWVKEDLRTAFDCRCKFCTLGVIEDEHHFVFSCGQLENIRLKDKYMDIFTSTSGSLKLFLNFKDQRVVGQALSAMMVATVWYYWDLDIWHIDQSCLLRLSLDAYIVT